MFDLLARGMSKAEIAYALGRTKYAVIFRLVRIKNTPGLYDRYIAYARSADSRRREREEQRRTLDCMPNPFRRGRNKYNNW